LAQIEEIKKDASSLKTRSDAITGPLEGGKKEALKELKRDIDKLESESKKLPTEQQLNDLVKPKPKTPRPNPKTPRPNPKTPATKPPEDPTISEEVTAATRNFNLKLNKINPFYNNILNIIPNNNDTNIYFNKIILHQLYSFLLLEQYLIVNKQAFIYFPVKYNLDETLTYTFEKLDKKTITQIGEEKILTLDDYNQDQNVKDFKFELSQINKIPPNNFINIGSGIAVGQWGTGNEKLAVLNFIHINFWANYLTLKYVNRVRFVNQKFDFHISNKINYQDTADKEGNAAIDENNILVWGANVTNFNNKNGKKIGGNGQAEGLNVQIPGLFGIISTPNGMKEKTMMDVVNTRECGPFNNKIINTTSITDFVSIFNHIK